MSAIVVFNLKLRKRRIYVGLYVENYDIEIVNLTDPEYLITHLSKPRRVTKFTYKDFKMRDGIKRMHDVIMKRTHNEVVMYPPQDNLVHKDLDIINLENIIIDKNTFYFKQ